jgi:signal transduction histidine kinase
MTTLLVGWIYFSHERQWLLDQQIEAIASGLLAAELQDAELAEMDDIVADELYDQPRVVTVNLFTPEGRIIYRNSQSLNIIEEIIPPVAPNLYTFQTTSHKIRILNLGLGEPTRGILQVGLLLDWEEGHWKELTRHFYLLLSIITLIIIAISVILARLVVRPIDDLTNYIDRLVEGITRKAPLDIPIPKRLRCFDEQNLKNPSELHHLLRNLGRLKEAVEIRLKMSESSSAQMAHEFKTPLTIIRNIFEMILLNEKNNLSPESSKLINEGLEETDHLDRTIGQFLEWSRVRFLAGEVPLHAINLVPMTRETISQLTALYPQQKINLVVEKDFQIFANREEVRQLLRNLIDNACKYSLPGQEVLIRIGENQLLVRNEANSIPSSVLRNLGMPFNSIAAGVEDSDGKKRRSTGLGLAWIMMICQKYNFEFSFDQKDQTVVAKVRFHQT